MSESEAVERTSRELAAIDRHKYFLSEDAGHDVGWEHAVHDWDEKYGEEFRAFHRGLPGGGKGISFLFRRLFK